MPNEDHPNILASHQPPETLDRFCARFLAKALADIERKIKEQEQAKKNNGQQKGEEQTKEPSSSSSSAPESKPGAHPSLLKPRPVFPGTMNIAILNNDWIPLVDEVDLKEQFQYEKEQQGREEASESAAGSKVAAIGDAETKGAR
ncbi:hypothetical protein GCG54_00002541 [Colletotrichum gloeosporioides]|uniref:Uncharacterized protein n=1 Tax=Colletotrichum gloeosporioides TaxID=474922 RepID=A0A8H4CU47_COLGL|nr:uncharacterized protein GCG54_00002541 [Colletotrichum gloeosporioides]KAF3810090.1 hypothetical protein GCG54_00002541 [Colletotrichum gloeosporioides]